MESGTLANHSHNAVQAVDVGCGIGGSSRHIAAKYGSSGKGVTLSPVQVRVSLHHSIFTRAQRSQHCTLSSCRTPS